MKITLFASLCALVLLPTANAGAQSEEKTVFVSVLDKAGAPVTGMTPGDFIVREDGMAREVLRVSPANEPMQIALLVDNSQEIDPHLIDLRRGISAFVKEIGPNNEVALIGLGERPTVLVDYTKDKARLEAGANKIFPRTGSGTHVLEAIVEASEALKKRKAARPVIVVFTAEGPEFSELYHEMVLDAVRESGAALHTMKLLTRRGNSTRDRAMQELDMTFSDGTQETGGRREDLITSMALADEFKEVATELNHQYQVVYSRPRTLIPPKERDVTLKRPELTVRASRKP
jgi:VWFA-related protein